jgi:hypothetical protein
MIQPAHAIVAAIGSIATTINEADNMFVDQMISPTAANIKKPQFKGGVRGDNNYYHTPKRQSVIQQYN